MRTCDLTGSRAQGLLFLHYSVAHLRKIAHRRTLVLTTKFPVRVFGHIPVGIFLLVNNFLDATLTSNIIFYKGQTNSAFSFSHMPMCGGLI